MGVPTSPTSLTVNNLLLGKSAIVSSRGRRLGPPPGAVPPSRHSTSNQSKEESRSRGHLNDTIDWKDEKNKKSLSRRGSVKWKDIKKENFPDRTRKPSIDLDESGDGVIVSEKEANEMIAAIRSRSSSETSSYSSHSASSTDTSLCDDNAKGSDSEIDLPIHSDKKKLLVKKHNILTPEVKMENLITNLNKNYVDNNELKNNSIQIVSPSISDFIESAAGEPLRTYLDEFQNEPILDIGNPLESTYKVSSSFTNANEEKVKEDNDINEFQKYKILSKTNSPNYSINNIVDGNSSAFKSDITSTFTELSPIDISPCKFNFTNDSIISYDYESIFKQPSTSILRSPDIIDSLTKYPNFVPDIDLSDKTTSECDSPPRSPGADSIVVSEDEPPIPLKIDKYFEHSPEFFGARFTITDPNNQDVPNRRAIRRQSRTPRKPDSLTLQSSYNETLLKHVEGERASSLPQNQSLFKTYIISGDDELKINTESREIISPKEKYTYVKCEETDYKYKEINEKQEIYTESEIDNYPEKDLSQKIECNKEDSPKSFSLRSGRKNSERALQIIQENSKILSRILTKQNLADKTENVSEKRSDENVNEDSYRCSFMSTSGKSIDSILKGSPLLKESTSDSVIGCSKDKNKETISTDKNYYLRNRPISLDDPFSLELKDIQINKVDIINTKSPSAENLVNKTDRYGWENKGFLAKCKYPNYREQLDEKFTFKSNDKTDLKSTEKSVTKPSTSINWSRPQDPLNSTNSMTSNALPSPELRDISNYEPNFISDNFNYQLSSNYNDFILSRASDICSKTVDLGPKVCENLPKTDTSQVSDFAHVVTSSISFTYDPSGEDDSPFGAKSNSSDTLCQITSLDQVSTPISPKIFSCRETPTHSKESKNEMSDTVKLETDDTCSAITSLIETDTLSSLSCPRSPSTGSFHPFPARPAIRMPKELGIRLGMYPRDSINSSSK